MEDLTIDDSGFYSDSEWFSQDTELYGTVLSVENSNADALVTTLSNFKDILKSKIGFSSTCRRVFNNNF